MEKLKMITNNGVEDNITKIGSLFPNCVTETTDAKGKSKLIVDFDKLRQELSDEIIEGKGERYEFVWPGKKDAILLANSPIKATLRPCEKESVDFANTNNIYIEGDNLDVLKCLKETYLDKVKMIYIDPPYNTGNDFIYNDNFAESVEDYMGNSGQYDDQGNRLVANTESNGRFHTDWLNMMFSRLKISRNLLSEDGVVFISIDDNELDNLIKLCNEVFGEVNHVGTLSVENNPKGRKNSSFISVSSEYCVIYAKNKDKSYFIENVPKKASDMTLDENGRYVHNSGKRVLVGDNSFNKKVSNPNSDKNYVVYYLSSENDLIIKKEKVGEHDDVLDFKGYVRYASEHNGELIENTYTEEKLKELFKEGALEFSNGKIYEKNFSDTIRIKSQLVNREYEAIVHGKKSTYSMELTTTGGGTCLKKLFNMSESPFQAPKNVGFLKLLISLFPPGPHYVLDFFSGSATTAHAVLMQNAEDGGNRKFIMVQVPEITYEGEIQKVKDENDNDVEKYVIDPLTSLPKVKKHSIASKAGYLTISEIGKERIRRAANKIREETGADIDYGFRVFKLDSSNIEDIYYAPAELNQGQLSLFANNVKPERSGEDLLFQTMLELGATLDSKIEKSKVCGKEIFNVSSLLKISYFFIFTAKTI